MKEEILIEEFIEIGKSIRLVLDEAIPRQEDLSIHDFVNNPDVESNLIFLKKSNDMCRILAYVKNDVGYLGWYESTQNHDLHNEMFEQAENWLRDKGCKEIYGPINGSTSGCYRFNMRNEIPLFYGEPCQPLFYVNYWLSSGYELGFKYVSEIPDKGMLKPSSLAAVKALLDPHGIQIHNFPEVLDKELEMKFYHFYHECFQNNPLYAQMSEKQYLDITKKMSSLIDTNLSFYLLNKEDDPIAVFIGLKDGYRSVREGVLKDETILTIKTIATSPRYQNYQIATGIVNLIHNLAYENSYTKVVHALMYQEGLTATVGSNKFNAEVIRNYSILKKCI